MKLTEEILLKEAEEPGKANILYSIKDEREVLAYIKNRLSIFIDENNLENINLEFKQLNEEYNIDEVKGLNILYNANNGIYDITNIFSNNFEDEFYTFYRGKENLYKDIYIKKYLKNIDLNEIDKLILELDKKGFNKYTLAKLHYFYK